MVDWRDRLDPIIILESPEGNVFDAFWIGNARSFEKSLGVFKRPGVQGAEIQDNARGPVSWPLVIYFAGPDHDIESEKFFEAAKEDGEWEIDHPTKGTLVLQLVSISEAIEPVVSGNITQFDTQWLEPNLKTVIRSTSEIGADIIGQSDTVNDVSSEQLEDNTIQNTAEQTFSIKSAVTKTISTVKSTISKLSETSAALNARALSIQRGIQTAIQAPVIAVTSLGGQIQNLVEFPLLATNDISSRLSSYGDMINGLLGIEASEPRISGRNTVAVKEVALVSAIVSISQIAATGLLQTRSQAIETSVKITELFDSIVNGLDADQEFFDGTDIDVQYFSQSASYSDALKIIALANQYLLQASFDLAVEKRFLLDKPSSPIVITINEYGSLGDNDSNFDLFIESNELKGNDILWLPAGREVVVYV
ncbi:MAG: hypothetical protein KAJ19_11910 [Gammaproteobacteria bacterium]|nr:hypothetical protein [Gammaproteobacteria bacterium]